MRKTLNHAQIAFLSDTFTRNRDRFGGWTMEELSEAEKVAAEKAAADKAVEDVKSKFEPITSQEDLDRRLGERLQRERAKFADYDENKKKAEAHDKAMAAAMSEQEKAVAAAKESGKSEALSAVNGRLVASEARALAAEAKFRNPSLAVKALDLAGVAVNDEGEPDKAAITAKLKELSDADPYLLDDGKKAGPKPDRAQGGSAGNPEATVQAGRSLFEQRRGRNKTNA